MPVLELFNDIMLAGCSQGWNKARDHFWSLKGGALFTLHSAICNLIV